MKKGYIVLLLICTCLLVSACGSALVVDSAGDEPDSNLSDGVCKTINNDCTLRAAIMEANVSDDISNITFQNVINIIPDTPLPALTENNTRINGEGKVTISGESYVTFSRQHNELGLHIGLEILDASNVYIQGMSINNFYWGIFIRAKDGSSTNNVIGALPSESGDLTKRNIIINNMVGITINGENASNNTVSGNFIGVDTDGITPRPNEIAGVQISGRANNNLIGSLSGTGISAGGNLISGNNGVGVVIYDADDNHISGNYIGSDISGTVRVDNYSGIRIGYGSFQNSIGYDLTGSGSMNLISGNEIFGIAISDSNNNFISGNNLGTNINGTQELHNTHGIWIEYGASGNIIGTDGNGTNDQAERNLISGNLENGIHINQDCISNVIAGNLIGTSINGSTPLGNGWAGIVTNGHNTRIGTNGDQNSDLLEANVISNSGTTGVNISSDYNVVSGNMIGVDQSGMNALGNSLDGILIYGNFNLIGTNGDGKADIDERNVISGTQSGAGVTIYGNNNTVAGNYIGTNGTGTSNLGDSQNGIVIGNGAANNLIGTDGDGVSDNIESNLVSGNGQGGIVLQDTSSNTIAGNLVGTDASGAAPLPNGYNNPSGIGAVHLGMNSIQNIIGTNGDGQNDSAEGNVISGNSGIGIKLSGTNTNNNVIAGNYVGVDISASSVLGNQRGIVLGVGADYNLIGTNADGISDIVEGNYIGGNNGEGISISGSFNQISGNYIGTDKFGTADLGNGSPGISITDNTTDNTIGGSVQKANIIAFNKNVGVSVAGLNANRVQILNNSIHTNDRNGIALDGPVPVGPFFTPNDSGDVDIGPNDLMNFPILSKASTIPGTISITGQIANGLPSTIFLIQFFDNDVCDSYGYHGEGKTFIGSLSQLTDSNGYAAFSSTFGGIVSAGHFITATATTDNKTSEFSECIEVTEGQVTYSQELEEGRCGEFEEEMKLTTFEVDPELLVLNFYVKKASAFPGSESEDPTEGMYSAFLGDIEARNCNFQGFTDRLYCNILIPESFLKTKQVLKIFFNDCGPPFYINENVTIFEKVPTPICSSDMNERDCIAAGGTYTVGANCTCP